MYLLGCCKEGFVFLAFPMSNLEILLMKTLTPDLPAKPNPATIRTFRSLSVGQYMIKPGNPSHASFTTMSAKMPTMPVSRNCGPDGMERPMEAIPHFFLRCR